MKRQTLIATVIGLLFILLGILGFLFQGMLPVLSTTTVHNTLYLLLGAAATTIGVWGAERMARLHNRALGTVLLLLAIIGFLQLQPLTVWLGLMLFDNSMHLILGAGVLVTAHTGYRKT
jgi:hypothetical protein